MGIFVTLAYIVIAYLTPGLVLGADLANYHAQVYIAILALILSAFAGEGSGIARMPQLYGVIGLCVAVPFSIAFAGLTRDAPLSLIEFAPNALVFIFIVSVFRSKRQLQLLVAVLFFVAVFVIANSVIALQANNFGSAYLLLQNVGGGDALIRIRGLGFIHDPNDLSQFMVGLIPLMFLFWEEGKSLWNLVFVLLPISVLIYGMFLAHSRGAMVALFVAAIVAGRRKIGLLRSAVLGVVLFAALVAVGWSGGRSNADTIERQEAWSEGLTLIRTHPIFGVGYLRFAEFYVITAHNSVVCCAAELGMVGLLSWLLIIVTSLRNAAQGNLPGPVDETYTADSYRRRGNPRARDEIPDTSGAPALAFSHAALGPSLEPARLRGQLLVESDKASSVPIPRIFAPDKPDYTIANAPASKRIFDPRLLSKVNEQEARRLSGLALVSLTGFLAAGWFLSRSYTMTLFVFVGIATSIYKIGRDAGTAPPQWPFSTALKMSVISAVCLFVLIYFFLRSHVQL